MLCTTLLAVAACGGGGREEATPSPTPDAFDPNVLNALVLQPDEVSVPQGGDFFDTSGSRVTYTATFGDNSYAIDRLRSRGYLMTLSANSDLPNCGTSVNTLIGGERNYQLPESDLAFLTKRA